MSKNLSVLICSDYSFLCNWMSFAAWYSVSKNLPQAKIALTVARNNSNMQLYRWVNKIDVKFFAHTNIGKKLDVPCLNKLYGVYITIKRGLVKQPLLVIDPDMLMTRSIDNKILEQLGKTNFAAVGPLWYFDDQPLEKFAEAINNIRLTSELDCLDAMSLQSVFGQPSIIEGICGDAEESQMMVFAHYRQKCGKFLRSDYENKTSCPFRDQSLYSDTMTVNERRIFALWSQMYPTFEALSR